MYLNIYAYGVGLFHVTFFIYRTFSFSPIFNNRYTVKFFLFLISRIFKQDDLATAFRTTLLTELEQNHSSGLVENDLSLFVEVLKYFYFVYVFFHC